MWPLAQAMRTAASWVAPARELGCVLCRVRHAKEAIVPEYREQFELN
jgi:hypothetical protein